MQDIKDSVGDGGRNDVHDVALVQAILRVVKTKAGVPHLSGNYDGAYGPVTKEAIIKFQTNQLLIGPVPSPEKVGLVARESVTFQKMVASLPENYKGMRIIQGTKTVYLEDAPERAREARAKLAHYGLQPAFRQKVGSLIAKVYAEYKIVVSVTGHAGGRRTFQEQRAVPITNTKAGPGESNHNFGNAAGQVLFLLETLAGRLFVETRTTWLTR